MGSGIVQVAAQNGHKVVLVDLNESVLDLSKTKLAKIMARLVEKGRITTDQADETKSNVQYSTDIHDFKNCGIVIEAIVENLGVKSKVFSQLEAITPEGCILASNTSLYRSLPLEHR